MTALAVIGGIFLLLLLVLALPVRVAFSYQSVGEKVSLKVYFLFFRFDLSPGAVMELAEKKAGAREKKPPKQKREKAEKEKEEKSPLDLLGTVLDLLRESKGPLGIIRRHIVFYRVRLYLIVCADNAHETAMRCAGFSNVIFALLTLLGRTFVLKNPTVLIYPDFAGTKSRSDLSFRLRIRPIFAVAAGINLLWRFLRRQMKRKPVRARDDKKLERKVSG